MSHKLPDTAQISLFPEEIDKEQSSVDSPSTVVEFQNPSPTKIFVGDTSLKTYLESRGLKWVIHLKKVIAESDLNRFLGTYQRRGRKAIHPALMLGLIVYGILEKKWSLRELESLTLRDLGAWWLCGGLQPDHSTIGKFINRHADVLTNEYFTELTKMLVKALRIKPGDSSGDGTVIEAAASHFKTLKTEAAQLAAEEAKKQADEKKDNQALQYQAEHAQKVAEVALQRSESRRKKGRDPKTTRVSPTEPEAAIQPLKSGARRPSYRPSVLSNAEKFIIGKHLSLTNEQEAIEPMLEQYREVFGAYPERLKVDANYCKNDILKTCVALNIDLLSPSGRVVQGEWEEKERKGKYRKHRFKYDEEGDIYLCPAGNKLKFVDTGKDVRGEPFRRFRCKDCHGCSEREKCTKDKKGRAVCRYEGDEYKEAMAIVMSDKRARSAYLYRKAEVEPIFAELRERQGLKRFRRRGESKVRLEFSLHCIAYNIKRAIRLAEVLLIAGFCWEDEKGNRSFCFLAIYFRSIHFQQTRF